MSGFYSASQFDHAFQPIKLRNFQYGTNPWPGKFAICSPPKCCNTCFIADDNGHLLPCIARNPCTSPWGDFSQWIWETAKPCCCISKLRHPEKYAAPRQIYITKEVTSPGDCATETAGEFNDPCTKEGMVEDYICGRDVSCPGRNKPMKPCIMASLMTGNPKTIHKTLRDQQRQMKRSRMANVRHIKGKTSPEVINLRFATGCGEAAKMGCKKYK